MEQDGAYGAIMICVLENGDVVEMDSKVCI